MHHGGQAMSSSSCVGGCYRSLFLLAGGSTVGQRRTRSEEVVA